MRAAENSPATPKLFSRFFEHAPEFALLVFAAVLGVGQLCWHIKTAGFDQTYGFSQLRPWGYDFRLSLQWGAALRAGGIESYLALPNAWPPFATLFYLPLTLIDLTLAYHILIGTLLLSLLVSIFISLRQFRRSAGGAVQNLMLVTILWALVLQSFPVVFAIERGNSDAIVVALVVFSLAALERDRRLMAVFMLTLATQLKMYPAILAVLFLLRRQYREFFIFGALNAAALFVLGPRALKHFVDSIGGLVAAAASGFNHSLFSYITERELSKFVGMNATTLLAIVSIFLLFIFSSLCLYSWWKGRADKVSAALDLSPVEAGLIGMAFSLMSLLPAISWDYKLLIQLVPLLLLVGVAKADPRISASMRVACIVIAASTAWMLLPNSGRPRTVELTINFFLYAFCAWSSIRASLFRTASLP